MRVFFQIAYFAIGLVQLFAVWDGAIYLFSAESFIGKGLAVLAAMFLTYIPLVGSALGVYGAVNVWEWSLTKSIILFFWYVPVFILFVGSSYLVSRK